MDIKALLPRHHVLLHLATAPRRDLLRQLAAPLAEDGLITDVEHFLDDLERREDQITTQIRKDIALPHARSECVRRLAFCVGVADGDTITVLDADKVQHKIRLAGIDAPEKKQAFGNRSKESLSDMVFDKTVNVETEKRDRYGRQIGKVLVNGQDVNLVQVERGMAWFYRQYQREQSPNDRRLYEAAEDAAKAGKRGLWRDAEPVPPWDFRHNKSKS